MNLPQIQHTNINDFLKQDEVVKETLDQIRRDFEQFGYDIILPSNLNNVYSLLLKQVTFTIEQMLLGESSQVYALLYRVDVSDHSIIQASQALPHYTHAELIAHQIIFRDLQKVLTRRYFKNEYRNTPLE